MLIKKLFETMLAETAGGKDTVLATIVAEIGSSPRSAGAHMLVSKNGRAEGTIGGGTVEYRAIEYAQKLLEQRRSGRKTYRLHRNDEEELGMICGGDVDVYFQYIRGNDATAIALMRECLTRLVKDEDLWLFIDLTNPADWSMALYGANVPLVGMELKADDRKALARNRGVLVNAGGRRMYGEPINFAGKVFIFGGGHCAQALEPVLTTVGFRCVVFDNREEFANRELFPSAYDVIIGDYERVSAQIELTPNDYIVIVTHAWDIVVLRQVISKNCAYLGVIGSKTKTAELRRQLSEEGVSEELLRAMNAPIGLRIRSETPEEIAISIAGEMILRRAERRAAALGNC